MRKPIRWALLIALVCASGGAATAGGGTKVAKDVSIIKGVVGLPPLLWVVSGSLGSARNDDPAMAKEIGCQLHPSLTGVITTCWANSPTGMQAEIRCSTDDPQLAAIASTIHSDSMVEFTLFTTYPNEWDYPANTCIGITVENASKYEPKAP
jgi:hypothetical protein